MPLMEFISHIVDFILHLDKHLQIIIEQYGVWTYLLVFLIIFCETGFVVTPFLPGDSLLFALGTFTATGALNLPLLLILLSVAAISGNMVNYAIGRLLAPQILRQQKIKFIKQEYIERTHRFYEKYGGKTIIITRFIPIIRTFAPFLAGVGTMSYFKFFSYNVIGGILWICFFTLGGYFFGNLPVVKENFSLVILIIIVLSLLPAVIEILRSRSHSSK